MKYASFMCLSFLVVTLMQLQATDDDASITEVVVGPILIVSGTGLCCLGRWCFKLSQIKANVIDRSRCRLDIEQQEYARELRAVRGEVLVPWVTIGSGCAGTLLTAAGIALTTVGAVQLSKK